MGARPTGRTGCEGGYDEMPDRQMPGTKAVLLRTQAQGGGPGHVGAEVVFDGRQHCGIGVERLDELSDGLGHAELHPKFGDVLGAELVPGIEEGPDGDGRVRVGPVVDDGDVATVQRDLFDVGSKDPNFLGRCLVFLRCILVIFDRLLPGFARR